MQVDFVEKDHGHYNCEIELPLGGVSVLFFTATDADGMLASSEHLVLLAAAL